jgi:Na+/proline symporter
MEMTEKMMKKFGAPQDTIDKAIADAAKTNPFSLSKMALGFAFYCIFWFLISLIVAAIVKKKNPADQMPQTM